MHTSVSEKAFLNLTEKQRIVWVMVMRDCLSEYEAARQLGLTRDIVHDRLNKARRSYRKFIKGVYKNVL